MILHRLSKTRIILYEDLAHSQRGVVVKLDLPDGAGLKAGSTPLMYQGLEVGQLSKLNLNGDGKVTGEMTVDPSVVSLLREKTLIQMKKPKISLDNPSVSALLTGTTFELVPGEGEPATSLRCCLPINPFWKSRMSRPSRSPRRKATASTPGSR
jgi:paraquat-inducible protein B